MEGLGSKLSLSWLGPGAHLGRNAVCSLCRKRIAVQVGERLETRRSAKEGCSVDCQPRRKRAGSKDQGLSPPEPWGEAAVFSDGKQWPCGQVMLAVFCSWQCLAKTLMLNSGDIKHMAKALIRIL